MALLVAFIGLLIAIRIPLVFALLFGSFAFVLWTNQVDPIVLPQTMFAGLDSFILLSVPLFLLTGNLMGATSLTSRLTGLAEAWIGHISGGLGQVCVSTNLVMAGMTGSATADTAAVSALLVPGMRRVGYKPAFAAALNASAGTLGPLIPPSILMLVYASIASTSVSQLFITGLVPGLLVAVLLMAYVYWHGRRQGVATAQAATMRDRLRATVRAIPALALPLLVLGGILGGIFTPTEAAAIAAAYAALVGFVGLRELTPALLVRALRETAVTTGVVMIIVAAANVLSWLLIVNGVGAAVTGLFAPIRHSPWLVLLLINGVFLVAGFILEPVPLMMLFVPVLLPLLRSMHVDLVQFGVIVALNTSIALVMPPFGLSMFIAIRMANVSVEEYSRAVWPLLGVLLLALLLITQFPPLTLALPAYFR